MAGRKVKNVSFSDNDYENGLHEYASRPEHGPFSVYVKRLIERDRKYGASVDLPTTQPTNTVNTVRPAPTQKDRNAALDML